MVYLEKVVSEAIEDSSVQLDASADVDDVAGLTNFLVGRVMKRTDGRVEPGRIQDEVERQLSEDYGVDL